MSAIDATPEREPPSPAAPATPARLTSDRVIAQNVGLSAIGWLIPVLLALVAIPLLVRQLGAARFGVLSLAWTLVGYLGLFDFGLGRALTQLVAERVGTDRRDQLPSLTWSALWMLMPLGVIAMTLLVALAPWLVRSILNVPPALHHEAIVAFRLLAVALPFTVATAGLRGVLEGLQAFRRVTALRVPLALVTFVGPLLVLPFAPTLPATVGVLTVGRALLWWAHLRAVRRELPELRPARAPRAADARPLLAVGGWITVSNLVSPLLSSFDRFVVGAVLSVTAVAYYTTAYEAVTRLWIITAVLLPVLFPALAVAVQCDRERAAGLFDRGSRAVLIATFPPALALSAFAPEWLHWWVGADLAVHAAPLAQGLAAAVLVNVTGQLAYTLVQSAGRADITGRLHLAELVPYGVLLWWLLHVAGTVGVVAAWTLRVAIDSAALLVVARRLLPEARRPIVRAAFVTAVTAPLVVLPAFVPSTFARATYAVVVLLVFAIVAWRRLLTQRERHALRDVVRARLRARGAAPDLA